MSSKGILVVLASVFAVGLSTDTCEDIYSNYGLSSNLNETIAHAIHSMNTIGLKLFNHLANEHNSIPTVNHDLSDKTKRVLNYAPNEEFGNDFSTFSMNVIDKILSTYGTDDDGLGEHWSMVERIAHKFHMFDTWNAIHNEWEKNIKYGEIKVSNELCNCLLDIHNNGIYDAVEWVAKNYETHTPITLLNKPIPKLTDYKSWAIWKDRLLHYYTKQALTDAALYLDCQTRQTI